VDYALITHFHSDHMGQVTPQMPLSTHGDYRLSGITEIAELMPVRKVIDRGWPDYLHPIPLTDAMVQNYRRFLDVRTRDGSLIAERIRVGRDDQLIMLFNPAAFPTFEIRNVAANGEVWTGHGTATKMRFPKFTTPDPRCLLGKCLQHRYPYSVRPLQLLYRRRHVRYSRSRNAELG
jgi:hypothetical protein